MTTEAAQARELREVVRCYLRERPDAADTLVGIAQWWLPARMRGVSIAQLRLALAELIAANEMQCTTLPDGSELYSRAVRPEPPPIEPDDVT